MASIKQQALTWPAWLLGLAMGGVVSVPASALETKSYVMGWFSQAVHSEDGDCPGGVNPDFSKQFVKNLVDLGMSPQEIEQRLGEESGTGITSSDVIRDMMYNRARIGGKPVNAYAHPAAVADPKLNMVGGKYAYGFDLDGRGSPPNGFEDPDTHERGVDNELFRALGCARAFRGTIDNPSSYWTFEWTAMRNSMPAWLMTLSGENLKGDGPVTITFDRAIEHAQFNADGKARAYMTFRVDPDARSHNVFAGEIKNGVISIAKPGNLRLLQAIMTSPEFKLAETHLRLKQRPDGSLEGFIGGYQSWREVYFGIAQGGLCAEITATGELPGLYYLMRRLADADADPKTGENRAISAAYRIEMVPAFAVPARPGDPKGGTAR